MSTAASPAGPGPAIRIEDVEPGVRVLSIDRPHRSHALDPPSATELRDALRAAQADEGVRVLVLTGTQGNFCAGADLKYRKAPGEESVLVRLQECHDAIVAGPRPCIAAIEGSAYGAGLSLALACDRIIAASTARCCAPFTGLGIVPDVGMVHSLPRRVGWARARLWMIEGTVVDAGQAHTHGLVDELTGPGAALEAALVRARAWARRSPLALAALRQLGNESPADAALLFARERELQARLAASEDFAEAVAAFAARRAPVFRGR